MRRTMVIDRRSARRRGGQLADQTIDLLLTLPVAGALLSVTVASWVTGGLLTLPGRSGRVDLHRCACQDDAWPVHHD